jgi:hypothetical protein
VYDLKASIKPSSRHSGTSNKIFSQRFLNIFEKQTFSELLQFKPIGRKSKQNWDEDDFCGDKSARIEGERGRMGVINL